MSRPDVGLVIAALLQAVALAVMATLPQWVEVLPTRLPGEQASAVVIGVALAQAALAALGMLLTSASGFVRVAGGTVLLAGAFLASVAYHRQADQGEELLLTAQVIGLFLWIAGLEALAVFGCLTRWGQYALRHPRVETTQRPAQFYLWHLLATMTAVGVLLALGRVAWGPLRSELELEPLQYVQMLAVIAIIATTSALLSLLTIATVLASRRGLALWCVSILLVGLASAGEIYLIELISGPHAEAWHWRMNYSTFAWVTLSLLPVRLAGWRMTRQRA